MSIDYSIIVPAYNEADFLPATLDSVMKAMEGIPDRHGEVIVVDNNSTDATAAIAGERGVRVVFEPYNQISRARNCGAAVANGQSLVFVDADTHISAELLRRALDNLDSGRCCGGGAVVQFDSHDSRVAQRFLRLWTWLSLTLRLAAGCFVYTSREGYRAVGGFSEQVYASEEIWFSRALDRWGRRRGQRFCMIAGEAAISSGRKTAWFNPAQQLLVISMMLLFPLFVRYRSLCGFWYRRPR